MGPKRIPLVAGNWKMNFDHLEATYFVQQLAWNLRAVHFDYKRCEIALMPSFTSLRSVQVAVESDNLKIRYGAQAVSVTSQGAFTGDVSADMIAHLGCSYVIVGHSERRKYHPEDDANIVDQVRAVLAAGMQPILCVGESYEERRKGIELDFAVGQVHDVTRDLSDEEAAKLIGGGLTQNAGSSGVAEKNLNRWTVIIALLWVAIIITLGLMTKFNLI